MLNKKIKLSAIAAIIASSVLSSTVVIASEPVQEEAKLQQARDVFNGLNKTIIEKRTTIETLATISSMSAYASNGEDDDDEQEEEKRKTEERWERDDNGDDWYYKEVFETNDDGEWEKVGTVSHKEGTEGYVERPSKDG